MSSERPKRSMTFSICRSSHNVRTISWSLVMTNPLDLSGASTARWLAAAPRKALCTACARTRRTGGGQRRRLDQFLLQHIERVIDAYAILFEPANRRATQTARGDIFRSEVH